MNLGKSVSFIGGVIGGTVDAIATKTIGTVKPFVGKITLAFSNIKWERQQRLQQRKLERLS